MSLEIRIFRCIFDNKEPTAEVKLSESWIYVCDEHLAHYKKNYKGVQSVRMVKKQETRSQRTRI